MIDYVIKNIPNPLGDIKAEMFKDQPLWKYVIKAVQDIEVINIELAEEYSLLGINKINQKEKSALLKR